MGYINIRDLPKLLQLDCDGKTPQKDVEVPKPDLKSQQENSQETVSLETNEDDKLENQTPEKDNVEASEKKCNSWNHLLSLRA